MEGAVLHMETVENSYLPISSVWISIIICSNVPLWFHWYRCDYISTVNIHFIV